MTYKDDTIWVFNRRLSRWLTGWNIVNILVGIVILRRGGFWRGVGSQNIGWGLINIGIAVIGTRVTQGRYDSLENPESPAILEKETRNLRRLLLVNAFLDLLYVAGGRRFAQGAGAEDSRRRGMGVGIMIQGALLFVWDVFLVRVMPKTNGKNSS